MADFEEDDDDDDDATGTPHRSVTVLVAIVICSSLMPVLCCRARWIAALAEGSSVALLEERSTVKDPTKQTITCRVSVGVVVG